MSEPTDIVSRMRLLESDHEPDGWPAVQMCEITALCNMIEEDRDRLEDDGITCYEGKDGYALVDKDQYEWLRREVDRLKYFLEDYKRDAKCYETAFDDAEADVMESVQKQMAELRAENARLKQELSNANREFDRVTGWGYSVLASQPALMDVTATLP